MLITKVATRLKKQRNECTVPCGNPMRPSAMPFSKLGPGRANRDGERGSTAAPVYPACYVVGFSRQMLDGQGPIRNGVYF